MIMTTSFSLCNNDFKIHFLKNCRKDAESLKILIKGNVNDDHGTNAESCGKPKEVNLDRYKTTNCHS